MAGIVEFRLLGPLEVVTDGEIAEIGSARQRIVLSMLLLEANQVVPLARLVDAVWADTPPTTSKSQVQTCISALRRQLAGDGSPCSIVTRSVGYVILLPDEALDVAKFEHLAACGRTAASEQRAEDAARYLREALALWRGPAAGGVESALVQAAATRLNEKRVSVLEECLELELSLGRHHDLTGDLSELVRQYPLRERLRAQHMLALYRSGRQAEALESFREARQLFIEELGLDPGEELRALERAVLASDPALELAPQVRRGRDWALQDASVIPRQLTAAIADFTGRQDLQERVTSLLSFGESEDSRYLPIGVFTGKAGVGKSALALHVAHAVRNDYPDGQLFAQLKEADGRPISPLALQSQFLTALGLAPSALPAGLAERTAVYRSALGERRILIVLDDADSVNQVMPLIPGCPSCALIVTSRYPLSGLHGAQHFEIGDLDEATSVELLARVIGAERVAAEPDAALTLVRLCGCLPLALRIVAAKLAMRTHWRIDKMVRRMTDEGRRLDELVLSGVGIRATLTLSYDSLSREARRLFLRLGLLGAADFASWVAAPLLDIDAESAGDVLDTLVEARLVEVRVYEDGLPRFRLHDLVRIYALERLAAEEPIAERARALQRLLGCWLSLAAEAHRRSYGGDFAILHGNAARWMLPAEVIDQLLVKPLSWLRSEQAGLVSAVLQAAQVGFDELCWDLAVTLVTLFESEHQADDWRKTHEVALEVTRRAGNLRGQAAVLCSLGNLAAVERVGDAAAYLESALRIFEKIEDPHGRALTLANLAFADRMAGRYERAHARYLAALADFRSAGDKVGEVDALTSIALIQMDLGQSEAGEEFLDEALDCCRTLRAPRIVAQTEYRLGEFFLARGDLDRAERTFRFVLQLVRDERDRVGEAHALQSLATVRTRQRQFAPAEADLRAALSLSRHLGDNLVHGRVLLAYAEFYLARDEPESATSLIDEASLVFGEFAMAAPWRPRLLELKARRDSHVGRTSAEVAARHVAFDFAADLRAAGLEDAGNHVLDPAGHQAPGPGGDHARRPRQLR